MKSISDAAPATLSVVIPCYNEEWTVQKCIERVLKIKSQELDLEIICVDDCSTDGSYQILKSLGRRHPEIKIVKHEVNRGKGAALKSGLALASGSIVAIQDADLEYDPQDLKRLIQPILSDQADVVLGSRFATAGTHRVLYFWHSLGNRFLTLLSNMFTDLNLTDMECCYKVFRREIIEQIDIQEKRFGVEPELVAKVAHLRPRIFEMGISYAGRTYEEGKKIGFKDGVRALYCIFRYNAAKLPVPLQFMIYLMIGGLSAIVNIGIFMTLKSWNLADNLSLPTAFFLAAALNYVLCVTFLFRHKARWNTFLEIATYLAVVIFAFFIDFGVTKWLLMSGLAALPAKSIACMIGLILNFAGRRFLVFPEPSSGGWKPQTSKAAPDHPEDVIK